MMSNKLVNFVNKLILQNVLHVVNIQIQKV